VKISKYRNMWDTIQEGHSRSHSRGDNRYNIYTHDHPAKSYRISRQNYEININNVIPKVHILASANRRLHINGSWYDCNSLAIGFARVSRGYPSKGEFTWEFTWFAGDSCKEKSGRKKRSNCVKAISGAQYKFKCIWHIIEQYFYKTSPSHSVKIFVSA